MIFRLGQRVRTTVDAPAGWPGAFAAPAGTLGVITNKSAVSSSYGVVLDGDPSGMPAGYEPHEITPAE
ncbi:hypothetical protein [Streptomyces noursei]|uniref:hypothetical protein n=1 Tax=Streptomyces noursei TaxID=1971 RepID=UPI0016789B08|nr:hypothetical protein [Streptomyces noursei]MCZ1014010.1 hypothetical protein [Streptomyces noursei]GGX49166.1 hypothetical protein GCM10010341_83510 [Streptomyces noursei]